MLEETTPSSKDLAKMATLKEQFRIKLVVGELAQKFSLSPERSKKLATLSTTWRKLANHRAVTFNDAEAFGKELIGMNLSEAIQAVKDSRKGNVAGLEKIITQSKKLTEYLKLTCHISL